MQLDLLNICGPEIINYDELSFSDDTVSQPIASSCWSKKHVKQTPIQGHREKKNSTTMY